MHSVHPEFETLGIGTSVIPTLCQVTIPTPEAIRMLRKMLHTSDIFAEVGEEFAKKFAPSNVDPIAWFWIEWLDRPLDFLGGRSAFKAVRNKEEHLVLHYLKLASN